MHMFTMTFHLEIDIIGHGYLCIVWTVQEQSHLVPLYSDAHRTYGGRAKA